MTLSELKALAEASLKIDDDYWYDADEVASGIEENEDCIYIAALSPERVLRMIAVIDAAKEMRKSQTVSSYPWIKDFDASLAALEK